MIISETRRLIQKLFLLGILLSCLGLLTSGAGARSLGLSQSAKDSALPCCSTCDADPTLLICRHGCSPSCRAEK